MYLNIQFFFLQNIAMYKNVYILNNTPTMYMNMIPEYQVTLL